MRRYYGVPAPAHGFSQPARMHAFGGGKRGCAGFPGSYRRQSKTRKSEAARHLSPIQLLDSPRALPIVTTLDDFLVPVELPVLYESTAKPVWAPFAKKVLRPRL